MSRRELRRKHGMARPEWSSDDRRRIVVVSATEDGRRLIERVYPAYARRLTELMSIFSDVEQEELAVLCTRLGRGIVADA